MAVARARDMHVVCIEAEVVAMKTGLILAAIFIVSGAKAKAAESSFAPIGRHYPIFRVEKNENPQNILVAYTKLKDDCTLDEMSKESGPIDYYWLMDGASYKRVHPLIKSGIRRRLEVSSPPTRQSFAIRLIDLKELDQDLGIATLTVSGHPLKNGGCDTQALIRLGPSDHNRTVQMASISTESVRTLWPPFRKIKSVTLVGRDQKSGEPVSRQYFAR